jgi:hypothetical protein
MADERSENARQIVELQQQLLDAEANITARDETIEYASHFLNLSVISYSIIYQYWVTIEDCRMM